MNTKNIKAYAPKARRQFIEAVTKRAAHFGLYPDRIADIKFEGSSAIIEGRAFTKKQGEQRQKLVKQVEAKSLATHEECFNLFVREVAYTWFNRFAAIRYMELHDYLEHGFRVLSHPNSSDSFEIMDHAADVCDLLALNKNDIIELKLDGNKEEELYREILLGQCHYLSKIMPFMFEAIDDAIELLLPDNLTKTDSILIGLVNEIPDEDWSEIEVIGWLYQFYISEHKDSVIGKVVKSEDIPAATQLFTPNWIVKYLIQNSLGRQWLATYPESGLKGKMEYYIEPAEQSDEVIEQLRAITPASIDPEQIKVLDPAAGSGHILVEVYEVLREIYLERGYRLREIPELILTKNIYGLDIDDRAAQLAGFALMMKAREDDRRIFQRVEDGEISLNIFSLQSTEHLDIPKLWKNLDLEGKLQKGSTGGLFEPADEFTQPTGIYKEYFELLKTLRTSFLQAKTLGSLIQIDNQYLAILVALKELLETRKQSLDPAAMQASADLMPIANQAITLALKYDVVIANPPYMGSKFQNSATKDFLKNGFKGYERDLFSCFIIRNIQLTKSDGYLGFMTPMVWMFLSSYERTRETLIGDSIISSLVQLEYNASGNVRVPLCTFTVKKSSIESYVSSFIRLVDFSGDSNQGPRTLEAIKNKTSWFYEKSLSKMKLISGMPIAYWIPDSVSSIFENNKSMGDEVVAKQGLATADNNKFLRYWWEVETDSIFFNCTNREEASESHKRWFPYNKGGEYRKWYGNQEYIVDWQSDGRRLHDFKPKAVIRSPHFYFKRSVSWSDITSATNAFRYYQPGFIHDSTGHSVFDLDDIQIKALLAFCNTNFATEMTKIINPTLHFHIGYFNVLPYPEKLLTVDLSHIDRLIELSKDEHNSKEVSWDFDNKTSRFTSDSKVVDTFLTDNEIEQKRITEARSLEELNNKIINGLYGLNDIYSSEVDESRVTLIRKGPEEFIVELISHFIGVLMGRYSLDREGLVYAHSGNNGFKDLVAEGAYQKFPADDDGLVPLSSEDWLFDDDATTRFKEFVKTIWGSENLNENLEFVAECLCINALKSKKGESAMDTVRRYFSTQFFKDHCKTYKKRPIYWLYSSGKQKAFECLVYLHRYNEGTLARMRTEYVTPLMGKYEAYNNQLINQLDGASTTQQRQIEKDLKSLAKKQTELSAFDENLKHFADQRISLDLDDGVKVNYGRFGNLLADVKGIHGKVVK